MSLITEAVTTVAQAQYLSVDQVFNTDFKRQRNLRGYHVLTGYLQPRAESQLLVRDNVTDEPLQFPPNCFPIKTFFIPTTPLESPDLSNSYLELYFYDDTSFSNSISEWNGYVDGEQLNSKAFVEMLDVYETLNTLSGYPYIGVDSSGDFTAGQIQVYMYYLPATLPL